MFCPQLLLVAPAGPPVAPWGPVVPDGSGGLGEARAGSGPIEPRGLLRLRRVARRDGQQHVIGCAEKPLRGGPEAVESCHNSGSLAGL